MLNHTWDPVVENKLISSAASPCFRCHEEDRRAQQNAEFLDDVPVMSATVLGLDLVLHELCIDFQMVSELVLSDVGATILILQLIDREFDFAAERPFRIGDCIASLDVSTWFGAISARSFTCNAEHAATTSLWRHCRLVAQYAQLVAESLGGVSPEDAYLVGLLHEVRAIESIMSSQKGSQGTAGRSTWFAMEESLPLFVLDAIHPEDDCGAPSAWTFILNAAHELAGAQTTSDASAVHDIRPLGARSRQRKPWPPVADCPSVHPSKPDLGTFEGFGAPEVAGSDGRRSAWRAAQIRMRGSLVRGTDELDTDWSRRS